MASKSSSLAWRSWSWSVAERERVATTGSRFPFSTASRLKNHAVCSIIRDMSLLTSNAPLPL